MSFFIKQFYQYFDCLARWEFDKCVDIFEVFGEDV